MRRIILKKSNKSISKVLNSIYLGLSNILTYQELLLLEALVRHCGGMSASKTIPTTLLYTGHGYLGEPDTSDYFNYNVRAVHPLVFDRRIDKEVLRKARQTLINKGFISYTIERSSTTKKTYSNYTIHHDTIVAIADARISLLDKVGMFSQATIGAGRRSKSLIVNTRDDLKRYDLLIRSHSIYKGVSYVVSCVHSIFRALCTHTGSSMIDNFAKILYTLTGDLRSKRSVYDSVAALVDSRVVDTTSTGLCVNISWGLGDGQATNAEIFRVYYA